MWGLPFPGRQHQKSKRAYYSPNHHHLARIILPIQCSFEQRILLCCKPLFRDSFAGWSMPCVPWWGNTMSLPAWNDGCCIWDLQASFTDPIIFNASKKIEDATFHDEQLLFRNLLPFHTISQPACLGIPQAYHNNGCLWLSDNVKNDILKSCLLPGLVSNNIKKERICEGNTVSSVSHFCSPCLLLATFDLSQGISSFK